MLFPSKIAKQTGGYGANWRALVAKRAGMSGVQWRQAISKLAGGTIDPVDWAEAIRSHTSADDWQKGIVDLVSQFSPLAYSPTLWLEPARGGLFQSFTGTTPATANGHVVGYMPDLSGNAKHFLSEADNTTRPTLQGIGTRPCLRFDGANDFLMRSDNLGLLSGTYTLAFAFKSNSPSVDARLFAAGNSASNNTLFIPIQCTSTVASSSSALYRNDAGIQLVNPATITNANVFNNSPHVFILTDDRTNIRTYVDGVTGAFTTWTPSGVFTINRMSLGCLLRAVSGNWWAGDVYGVVVIKRVLTSTERAQLRTYMGALAGLSL